MIKQLIADITRVIQYSMPINYCNYVLDSDVDNETTILEKIVGEVDKIGECYTDDDIRNAIGKVLAKCLA